MGRPLTWDCRHRVLYSHSTAVVFVSLLFAISLKDKQKKGYNWKATASKWLPGGYSFFCLSPDSL